LIGKEVKSRFLIKTKLALRPHAIVASRPRRQGSGDKRPASRGALDAAPGSPGTGCNAALEEAQGVVCPKRLKAKEKKFKKVLDKAGVVRDGQ